VMGVQSNFHNSFDTISRSSIIAMRGRCKFSVPSQMEGWPVDHHRSFEPSGRFEDSRLVEAFGVAEYTPSHRS
jgi:hypothetical protein